MKKYFNFLSALTLTVMLAVIGTACNNNNGNEPSVDNFSADIATLVSMDDSGAVFTVIPEDDGTPFSLTFSGYKLSPEMFTVGNRYLILYTPVTSPGGPGGASRLLGFLYVYNGTITEGTAESTSSWRTMQQDLVAMWRSGNWINIQANLTYVKDGTPKKYELVVDETTLDNEYPEVHLIYEPDDSPLAETKTFYASFNIESIWERPNVKGIRITAIINQGPRTFTFTKQQAENFEPVS